MPASEPVADATAEPLEGTPSEVPPSAPVPTGDAVTDFLEQINYRRQQAGQDRLVRNPVLDASAQHHVQYFQANENPYFSGVDAYAVDLETAGLPHFTGVFVDDRVRAAGYEFNPRLAHWFGEAIGFPGTSPGIETAEEAMEAPDRRVVFLDPAYLEVGAGSASSAGNRVIVADFAGKGHSLPVGYLRYPFDGQRDVPTSTTPYEYMGSMVAPRGYPITVQAGWHDDFRQVTSFTIRPRGGAPLETDFYGDVMYKPPYAALCPRQPLAPRTTYDVDFVGVYSFSWSFTTR